MCGRVETELKQELFVALRFAKKVNFPYKPLSDEAQFLYDMYVWPESCLKTGLYEDTCKAVAKAESIHFKDEKLLQRCRKSRDMTPMSRESGW